jgi:hypothetical protein
MTDYVGELAAKSGARTHPVGAEQRPDGTAPRQARPATAPAPLTAPVEVRQQSAKPRRGEIVITRGTGEDGKPILIITPQPGFAIARLVCRDIDQATKRCRPVVVTERRKGRPANSQRRQNGAAE